jgi:hypothetical protein
MFSALTIAISFGLLALSGDPGTTSTGQLLLISLGCTSVASFVYVPPQLAALTPPEAERGSEARVFAAPLAAASRVLPTPKAPAVLAPLCHYPRNS